MVVITCNDYTLAYPIAGVEEIVFFPGRINLLHSVFYRS